MNPSYASNWTPPGTSGFEETTINDFPVIDRYHYALENIPPSGGGGCHAALLGIANLGRAANVSREQIATDLAAHVHGTRPVTAKEIQEAIRKAFDTEPPRRLTPRVAVDGEKLLSTVLERGIDFTEATLFDASPVRIDWTVDRDGIEVLSRLYSPEERLFLGTKHDAGAQHVQTVAEWIRRFERGFVPEHIVPNPLTGKQGAKKDGGLSYRADACVEKFRFAVLEFDSMPREQQIWFWAGVKLPVAALIDSGGKSIHAWVRIDAEDANEWTERVEEKLFDILTAVGIDKTCKNEARLSRTPGHLRDGKRPQRVLYLAPEGKPVQP
jgi:hypothetical protein